MGYQFDSRFDVEYDGEIPDSVDEAALRRMEAVAQALDESLEIPGTNISIGLDPILGVVPVVGDVVSAGLSLYIVAESANLGVSYTTLLGMLGTITIDVAGGALPYVGGIFDALWKANRYNVELALNDLAEPITEEATAEEEDGDEETTGSVEIPVQTD
jgi:hypothetical protein